MLKQVYDAIQHKKLVLWESKCSYTLTHTHTWHGTIDKVMNSKHMFTIRRDTKQTYKAYFNFFIYKCTKVKVNEQNWGEEEQQGTCSIHSMVCIRYMFKYLVKTATTCNKLCILCEKLLFLVIAQIFKIYAKIKRNLVFYWKLN